MARPVSPEEEEEATRQSLEPHSVIAPPPSILLSIEELSAFYSIHILLGIDAYL